MPCVVHALPALVLSRRRAWRCLQGAQVHHPRAHAKAGNGCRRAEVGGAQHQSDAALLSSRLHFRSWIEAWETAEELFNRGSLAVFLFFWEVLIRIVKVVFQFGKKCDGNTIFS